MTQVSYDALQTAINVHVNPFPENRRHELFSAYPEYRRACAAGAWDNCPELRPLAETLLAGEGGDGAARMMFAQVMQAATSATRARQQEIESEINAGDAIIRRAQTERPDAELFRLAADAIEAQHALRTELAAARAKVAALSTISDLGMAATAQRPA